MLELSFSCAVVCFGWALLSSLLPGASLLRILLCCFLHALFAVISKDTDCAIVLHFGLINGSFVVWAYRRFVSVECAGILL